MRLLQYRLPHAGPRNKSGVTEDGWQARWPNRAIAALLPLLVLSAAEPDLCANLAQVRIPGLTSVRATSRGGLCRIEAVARPRPRTAIGIEVWLPPTARWSGRYYQMGNGGFAGHIDAATLEAAARRGDAAAATGTGHSGDGFDARWAVGRPDLVADYAYRSIKVTHDASLALARAYYGRAPRRRYFMGCSFGGRQALVAAARWPRDWDGVIAGAPAIRWVDRLQGFARIQRALRTVSGAMVTPEQIAGTPMLNPAQTRALAAIEAAGYPRAQADAGEWRQWILAPDPALRSQLTFATQGYRYLFGYGEGWQLTDSDAVPPAVRATFAVGDLRPFLRRGGRVLSYFGTADAVLPPGFAVSDAQALGGRSPDYRLFLIPGMAHCQGGAAPHAIGQSLAAPAAVDDARHDVRRALEAWVEQGHRPTELIAGTDVRLTPAW